MLSSLFAAMGQGVSECRPCSAKADPINDTVSVDPTLLQQPIPGSPKLFGEQQVDLQQEDERTAEERAEEARQRALAEQEAEAAARAVEDQRRAEEAERQEQQRTAEAEVQQQQRLAEKAQCEREEQERQEVEAAALEEAEKALVVVAKQEARRVVDTFLKKRGFKSLAAPRKAFCGPTVYPLFSAVEDGDVELVKAMLLCDASISSQMNSSGKTARQVAERLNSGGSYDAVLAELPQFG